MRHLIALPLIFTAAPAAAQALPPYPTTLSVVAESKVERAPDVADISAGVVTQAATANEAIRANAEKMTGVIATLKRAGIAERDIQSSSINLQPQYRYQDGQAPVLTGYQASNTVSVQLRKLAEMGRTVDALVSVGANQINGPIFRVDKPDAALDEARAAAVGKARARAELYARAAGLRVSRILSIGENGASPPVYPMAVRAMSMKVATDTPVAPGEIGLTASVSVVFELQ